MPLGFGKSVLTASSAAATTAYAFHGPNYSAANTSQASFNVTMTNRFADASALSIVYWFRLKAVAEVENGDDSVMLAYYDSDDTGGGQLKIAYSAGGTSSITMNLYNGDTNLVMRSRAVGDYDTSAEFLSNIFDGQWHCLMTAMDMATGANRKMFIDGVDVTSGFNNNSAMDTTTDVVKPDLDDIRYIVLRYQPSDFNSSAYNASQEFCGDTGPIWVYDSYLDFTSSTVRGYFFNVANTDGFVNGGTAGTSGGATQPKLYLYHNGSTLVNGGSLNNTVNTATINSGTISVIPNTEGPGSGHTRT
jgi:hypothetical protein